MKKLASDAGVFFSRAMQVRRGGAWACPAASAGAPRPSPGGAFPPPRWRVEAPAEAGRRFPARGGLDGCCLAGPQPGAGGSGRC